MPTESQKEHKRITDLRIPYRSFDSPTSVDNMWQDGRNCYSNSRGYLERRPGFGATVEPTPTTFGRVQRVFMWARWAGTSNEGYYIMVSSLEAGVATVWKFRVGHDASAVKIFTSAAAAPFDFVEANNHCLFGNGVEMRKYDGTTVTNWGIVKPVSPPGVVAKSGYIAGTADTAEGLYYCYTYGNSDTKHESSSSAIAPKIVPGTTTTADTTKVSLSGPVTAYYWGDSPHSGSIANYIWRNPSDSASTGPDRTIDTARGTMTGSSLLFDPAANGKQEVPVTWVTFDEQGNQTGTQYLFSPALENEGYSDFNVCIVGMLYIPAAGAYTINVLGKDDFLLGIGGGATWSGTQTGITGQTKTVVGGYPLIPRTHESSGEGGYRSTASVAVTFDAAGLYPIEIDWDYWYHSGRILTVKCGSDDIKPVATTTSVDVSSTLGVVASDDPQVDEIHVYRTTYGGSYDPSKMQELPGSPYTNVDATITDTSLDTDLLLSYAPGHYSNDPPPLSRGFVWSQQRIWCFAGSKLYYSGYEELVKGVPEESFPSSTDGNWRPYKREIHALAPMSNGLAILTSLTEYGVDGDTLDTFRWGTLLEKRGTKSNTLVTNVGSTILWGDTSSQIWNSDSGEIGKDIRPDLARFEPSTTFLITHIAEELHWVLVLDSARSKLWVHNLDTGHWQVPWTVSATAICSGETADGVVELIAAIDGTTLCKLTPEITDGGGNTVLSGVFLDNGDAYDAWVRGNLFDVSGDKATGQSGVIDYLEIERNPVPLINVLQSNDESTHKSNSYTSIFSNEIAPPQRGQGVEIVAKRYMSQPETMNTGAAACKRASFELRWGVSADKFELYTIDVAHHAVVAR